MKFYHKPRGYWCLSKFAKWLRVKAGLSNPSALSWEDWKLHKQECKAKAPFIYWLTNKGFNKIQNILHYPADLIYSIKVYFKNVKGNTHVLEGGLEKGVWYDLCSRIPACLFYELDKFITQEKGLETLEWEKSLVFDESWGVEKNDPRYGTLTQQALNAIEQEEIWSWWKESKDIEVDYDQEEAYHEKEEEMLIRLIKIRHSLWT